MWHKPCRTFHPWCLCIKTRCLYVYDMQPQWVHWFCFRGGLDDVMEYIIDDISNLLFFTYQYTPNLKIWNYWSVAEIKMTTFWLQISCFPWVCGNVWNGHACSLVCSVASCLHTLTYHRVTWCHTLVMSFHNPCGARKVNLLNSQPVTESQSLLFHRVYMAIWLSYERCSFPLDETFIW